MTTTAPAPLGPSANANSSSPVLVVAVGASAGGLAACQRLLEGAPADQGLTFVVVLHLAPGQESHVAGILQKVTRMPVSQVTGKERVRPNHVYVIAPSTSLAIRDGALAAGEPEEPHYRARPIDAFFTALAADQKEGAAGIVLSGTGNDGSAGLVDIRSAGGLCLVQDPETAEYGGMPQSAIDTGAADAVVPPGEMGAILLRYAATPRVRPTASEPLQAASSEPGEELQEILKLVAKRYRLDFRDYKTGTLERRTGRRIELKHLSGRREYLEYLRTHPGEVDELYRDLLIGVTSFFRDATEWELFERELAPALVKESDDATTVRVWSAGCATGEEAYSLAMVLLEQIEAAGSRLRLRVFASDASDAALAIARRGQYSAGIEEHVDANRLRRFFRRSGEGYEVERPLRDVITFAAHDLLADPPFAQLQLVSCRNVLIYLEPAAQERLLELFHFALGPRGILWLGASETIGRRIDLFEKVSGKHRIYRSIGPPRVHGYRRARSRPAEQALPQVPPEGREPIQTPKVPRLLEKLVLQRHTSPCVVIDQGLEILYFFGPTGRFLTQPQGEARLGLLSWVRPELYAKLRAGLAEAIEQKRQVTVTGMRLEPDAAGDWVEIVIEPIRSVPRTGGLFLVAFRDLPSPPGLSLSPDGGKVDTLSGQLQQELQDTREQLRAAVDQLRTATEEHSASYEEILTLNEEFQSSNEELEASKEELQSLNEELTTINRQLEERNEELRSLTSDLNNLLTTANVPTLFLDRELRIRRFTPACSAIMRIVSTDIGRSLPDIKMQVRDERLLADAMRVLSQSASIGAEVQTDDGRWFSRNILPYRTPEEGTDGVCLTFHDITVQKQAAAASEYARQYAESIIRTSRTPLLVLDMDHRLVSANAAFYVTFQVDAEETEGRRIYELGNRQWDIPRVRTLLEETLLRGRQIRDYDVDHVFEKIGWRSMRLNADVMSRDGRPDLILVSIEDVTDLRKAELAAESRAAELLQDHNRKDEFLAMLGHELRNPLAALTHGLHRLRLTGGSSAEQIGMMERQTQRMAAMLDQLLDVARLISGKFVLKHDAADVAEAARAAIESVKPMLEAAAHDLEVSLPPAGTVLVLGDSLRLAQVIENLLGNAAKYTENGGEIWLTVDATDDTVKLSVRDTGIGMEPELVEHIFDLFTQGPESLRRGSGGLGLGLPLVRSLVQLHGGDVAAFSAGPGKGTEMVVTLPRLRRGALAKPKKEPLARLAATARKILVVDDEADPAQALVEILSLQGHDARAVSDGIGALTAVGAFVPDVVLLDLGLPQMDGYEVARRLREVLGKKVLLVALTGYRDDRARLQSAGFDRHLLKPASLEKLVGLFADLDRRDAETTPRLEVGS